MLHSQYLRCQVAFEAHEATDNRLGTMKGWPLALATGSERIIGVIERRVTPWRDKGEILKFLAWLVGIIRQKGISEKICGLLGSRFAFSTS